MALSRTEANSVSKEYFDDTIKQEAYEESVFTAKLKKMKRVVPGGTDMLFPIRYQQYGKAKAVGFNEAITFTTKDTRTSFKLDWKAYESSTMMTWKERVQNNGNLAAIKLVSDKTAELKEDFDEAFADDLFSTSQDNSKISSLCTIVDSTTNYGDVAYTDVSCWAGKEDSSTTVLNLYGAASLSYMVNQATFGKRKPTLHITTKDLWSKFESILEPQKRYASNDEGVAGFESLAFKTAAVVADNHCPSGYWFGLCMDEFELIYHPDYNFVVTEWQELFESGFNNHLAKVMSWAGELACYSRQVNFKMTALDYTK